MSLIPYYLQYLSEICEGTRQAPEGLALSEQDDLKKALQLQAGIAEMGIPAFVRACAAQDGTVLPEELFVTESSDLGGLQFFLQGAETPEAAPERPATPDPDANKHAFEVFLDCIAMDDGLVQYLIDVLKRMDRAEFFKLSQITTKLDLDPEEFLYWLGRREPFILILYGKTYLPAVGPLRIVVWYTAFSYLGVARNAWMVCENRQKYLKYLYISAAALNVVLNFALIPSWGASGAAAASLITQAAIWQAAWPPIPRFPVC